MAKFNFIDLNEEVRQFMLSEILSDADQNKLFISNRLNQLGIDNYKAFLIKSVTEGDEEMLEKLLDINTFFNSTDFRLGKPVKMPSNASTLISQSEFNRYYIRGICLKALSENKDQVEIYRARASSQSRPDSEVRIGTKISSQELLDDIRDSIGVEPKLFPEINSGLSIKL